MTDDPILGGQPQEGDRSDGQPCPLCDGKGGIVRYAGGGGTVAVRYVGGYCNGKPNDTSSSSFFIVTVRHDCGYCNGAGLVRTEPPTTDDKHD